MPLHKRSSTQQNQQPTQQIQAQAKELSPYLTSFYWGAGLGTLTGTTFAALSPKLRKEFIKNALLYGLLGGTAGGFGALLGTSMFEGMELMRQAREWAEERQRVHLNVLADPLGIGNIKLPSLGLDRVWNFISGLYQKLSE